MNENMEQLSNLTDAMSSKLKAKEKVFDELGAVKTVDEKLTQATDLIQDAQVFLQEATAQSLEADQSATAISIAGDVAATVASIAKDVAATVASKESDAIASALSKEGDEAKDTEIAVLKRELADALALIEQLRK